MSLPVLRRLPIPVREPYEAFKVREVDAFPAVAATQGTLALQLDAPGMTAPRPFFDRPRPVPAGDCSGLPEPREWATTFLKAAMEVAAGMRSPTQLIRWTTPEVYEALARRGALAARVHRVVVSMAVKPTVRTIRMSSPRSGRWEVAGVTVDHERVRAIAFRMERFESRWRVTALEIG